jgi:hypothetical protein
MGYCNQIINRPPIDEEEISMHKLIFRLSLFLLAATTLTNHAHADGLPVGTYSLSLQTANSGIHHTSPIEGVLSGTITFDSTSHITAADLIFQDTTDGTEMIFNNPGPTTIVPPPDVHNSVSAQIFDAADPTIYYYFDVHVGNDGSYSILCGVDCPTYIAFPDGSGPSFEYGELTPVSSPVPEPSTLVLIGSGILGAAGAIRRRLA